jgi:hypothetical protein
MAAPIGNQYGARAKQWQMAIERALDKRGAMDRRTALDELAAVLLDQCAMGEAWALRELGDRLDGKPAQSVTGADGGPIDIRQWTWLPIQE